MMKEELHSLFAGRRMEVLEKKEKKRFPKDFSLFFTVLPHVRLNFLICKASLYCPFSYSLH